MSGRQEDKKEAQIFTYERLKKIFEYKLPKAKNVEHHALNNDAGFLIHFRDQNPSEIALTPEQHTDLMQIYDTTKKQDQASVKKYLHEFKEAAPAYEKWKQESILDTTHTMSMKDVHRHEKVAAIINFCKARQATGTYLNTLKFDDTTVAFDLSRTIDEMDQSRYEKYGISSPLRAKSESRGDEYDAQVLGYNSEADKLIAQAITMVHKPGKYFFEKTASRKILEKEFLKDFSEECKEFRKNSPDDPVPLSEIWEKLMGNYDKLGKNITVKPKSSFDMLHQKIITQSQKEGNIYNKYKDIIFGRLASSHKRTY